MPGKRDNAYWLRRLKAEHPAVYTKLKAGKIASVRQACAEARLIRLPHRVDAMKREWTGATAAEQREFLRWVRSTVPSRGPSKPASGLVGADGKLTAHARSRVEAAMAEWSMKPGQVMRMMGYSPLNVTLGNVLNDIWTPDADFVERLARWLERAEKR